MILTQPIVPTVRDASLPAFLVALAVYLTPSVVAFTINRKHSRAVLTINLFLGWSLVGWAVSLAMASSDCGRQRCRYRRICRSQVRRFPPQAPDVPGSAGPERRP